MRTALRRAQRQSVSLAQTNDLLYELLSVRRVPATVNEFSSVGRPFRILGRILLFGTSRWPDVAEAERVTTVVSLYESSLPFSDLTGRG